MRWWRALLVELMGGGSRPVPVPVPATALHWSGHGWCYGDAGTCPCGHITISR